VSGSLPKEKITKMEPSRKKGIFVGYNETSKAYKIYVPSQRYIKVSRDITFHEEVAFNQSKESQQDTEMEEPEEPLDQVDNVALMAQISDAEPTIYEDVAKQEVWKDAIVEEYQYNMKNDVWEVVPRPEGNLWLFPTGCSKSTCS
jgi:hypothetical protein